MNFLFTVYNHCSFLFQFEYGKLKGLGGGTWTTQYQHSPVQAPHSLCHWGNSQTRTVIRIVIYLHCAGKEGSAAHLCGQAKELMKQRPGWASMVVATNLVPQFKQLIDSMGRHTDFPLQLSTLGNLTFHLSWLYTPQISDNCASNLAWLM